MMGLGSDFSDLRKFANYILVHFNASQVYVGRNKLIMVVDPHSGVYDWGESNGWCSLLANVSTVCGARTHNGMHLQTSVNIKIIKRVVVFGNPNLNSQFIEGRF